MLAKSVTRQERCFAGYLPALPPLIIIAEGEYHKQDYKADLSFFSLRFSQLVPGAGRGFLPGAGKGFLIQGSLFCVWQHSRVPYVGFLVAMDGRICPNKEPIM